MSSLQDLINLAKADGGKFFVIDESGDAKLVIMPVEEYQRLLLGKLQRQIQDVEQINKEIIRAQLSEDPAQEPIRPATKPAEKGPIVTQNSSVPRVDLRAEVIDPSFDFEGPKTDVDDL
jgi:hypothetical protein